MFHADPRGILALVAEARQGGGISQKERELQDRDRPEPA
jgi:hypothetical protein